MVTIEEKNKMIAEFMGYKWLDDDKMWVKGEWPKGTHMDKYLEYDTSWEWLMPVVKQCKNILNNPRNADDLYILWELEIAIFSCDITIAFNGVVGFINWYNKQK